MLADGRAVKVCITRKPYREMSEMELGKSSHVRLSVHHEVRDPLIVGREYIEVPRTRNFKVEILGSPYLIGNGIVLDHYVVIDPVITVKDSHESGNFGPVPDVIRSISGLPCTVDHAVYARVQISD